MVDKFTKDSLKIVVGQICQTVGWHAIHATPLEILVDVLRRYLEEITRSARRYSDQFGRTLPNLDDVGLAFAELGLNLSELEEYVNFVDPVPCNVQVPKYPVPRETKLNFLKPGSKEVVTRPVHVHEHLPPMLPDESPSTAPASPPETHNVFKRPGDPGDSPALKRVRLALEEEGRPLREISSVMMTTGGFLSPAREGKLPEPKVALPSADPRTSPPPPSSYPSVPPDVNRTEKVKKEPKPEKEKKREKKVTSEKLASVKETAKLKALKPTLKPATQSPAPVKLVRTPLPQPLPDPVPKSLIEKLSESPHLVVTPVTPQPRQSVPLPYDRKDPGVVIAKLSTEPDKQKLNIFKKISKVKEEPRASPEPPPRVKPPVKIERPRTPEITYDPPISPGNPPTPRTPEPLRRSPEHKRKKNKDKKKKKVERPKTPDVIENPAQRMFPFFQHFPPAPGLIPPLLSQYPLPVGGPKFPNLPLPPPLFMHPSPSPDSPPPAVLPPSISKETKSPLSMLMSRDKSLEKKQKEHKKDKKDKIKKKKDKKEKTKKGDKKRKEEKHKEHKVKEKKEKKKEKVKEKEEKQESVPKLTLKLGPASPRPPERSRTPEPPPTRAPTPPRQPLPPPLPPQPQPPEVARISALFSKPPRPEVVKPLTIVTPPTPSVGSGGASGSTGAPTIMKSPGMIIDKDGNKVWICPTCGRPDDGTPMIGCDECDAWYHWVCVGIQVPPDDSEDWYCRFCIVKKQGAQSEKKKRGRKKKPPV